MPYRIDVHDTSDRALDRLVALGALDIEAINDWIAAIMPDSVDSVTVERALGAEVRVAPACGRDDGSVWIVSPRAVNTAGFHVVPAAWPPETGTLRMNDTPAFGTGLHPSTSLCLEALGDEMAAASPRTMLDVGTGSGILALAAVSAGVSRAVAIDLDLDALRAAADNARLNALRSRVWLIQCAPDALTGAWPLVLANLMAAPLMDMAPVLARRVAHGGRLVLSGIRSSLADDVAQAYTRVGMRLVRSQIRHGWTALVLHPTW